METFSYINKLKARVKVNAKDRMRVLFIDVCCKSGSTGKIVYSLFKKLKAAGYEAAVCYGRGRIVREAGAERFSPVWEVHAHTLLTRLTGLTGCFSLIATRRLLRRIKAFKQDIAHIHEM